MSQDNTNEKLMGHEPSSANEGCCFVAGRFVFRLLWGCLAISGVVLYWIGIENMLDEYVPETIWGELACIGVGAMLLAITNGMTAAFFLSPLTAEQYGSREPLADESQSVFTNTGHNADLKYDTPASSAPPSSPASTGTSPSFSSSASSSSVMSSPPSPAAATTPRPPRSYCCIIFLLYLRAIFAITGAVFTWKGVWNILDLYIYHSTLAREIVYVIVGLLLIIITQTLFVNAGMNLDHELRYWEAPERRNTWITSTMLEMVGGRSLPRVPTRAQVTEAMGPDASPTQ